MKVLWLAPALNHYRIRFFEQLAKNQNIELYILAGLGIVNNEADSETTDKVKFFNFFRIRVSKDRFGFSHEVRSFIRRQYRNFDWIMIPAEKKNILLLLYILLLKSKNRRLKIFTYNHPLLRSGRSTVTILDKLLSKILFSVYDKVVFYTQESMEWAIRNRYIAQNKAHWANNTLDISSIKMHYSFILPPTESDTYSILFIGRLIKTKKIDLALEYFIELKARMIKKGFRVVFEIIGDGPQSVVVQEAMRAEPDILWHGKIIDEKEISPIMKRTSFVFLPGASGLSINHAFAYGRPYITIMSDGHGPEINYIKDNINGLILKGEFDKDITQLEELLTDNERLTKMCRNAFDTSKKLTVENWASQLITALKN